MLFRDVLYIVTCGKINNGFVKMKEIKLDANAWGQARIVRVREYRADHSGHAV
jgi:hypothetical protein